MRMMGTSIKLGGRECWRGEVEGPGGEGGGASRDGREGTVALQVIGKVARQMQSGLVAMSEEG